MIDKNEIGKRIRKLRKEASLSIDDMAYELEIGYETYRRIETGETLVTTKNLLIIANVLGVSTDYILRGSVEGIDDKEFIQLINKLSYKDRIKAKKILVAAFST